MPQNRASDTKYRKWCTSMKKLQGMFFPKESKRPRSLRREEEEEEDQEEEEAGLGFEGEWRWRWR